MKDFKSLCEQVNAFNPDIHLEYLELESNPGDHRVVCTNIPCHSVITYCFRTIDEFITWLNEDDDCTPI